MSAKKDKTFKRITNSEIYDEIVEIHNTINKVLLEAKTTNGRVTANEKAINRIWLAFGGMVTVFVTVALFIISLIIKAK